jgi:hypothetical protein
MKNLHRLLAVASAAFFIACAPAAAQAPIAGSVFTGLVRGTLSGGGTDAAFQASAAIPSYAWQATGQPADQKIWDVITIGETLQFRAVNDANSSANSWMTVTRAGTSVSSVGIPVPVALGGCSPSVLLCVNGSTYFNSLSANALTVATSGLTNPVFNVDNSTASSATGINVKSAASGGGVSIAAISPATNEDIFLNAKGTGRVVTNSSLNIAPASSSLTQGLQITQTAAGTIAPVPPFTFTTANALNYINVTSDTVDNGDFVERTAFAVIQKSGGSTVTGQRSAFTAEQWLTAATAPGLLELDIVGSSSRSYGAVADGHNFIAGNSIAALFTGAGHAVGLSGHEIDILIQPGASTTNKFGLTIVQVESDAVQGSVTDAGIAFYNGGTSGGWKTGIFFTGSTVASGGVGIDMSALTLGGPAYLIKGPGSRFYVDGNGNAGVNHLSVLAGASNAIIVNGSTSGAGQFIVPAVLGTPNWTLPTNTGTFAVSASSPLVDNATTGNLTCPTCTTSAASLALNQLVVGSGLQGMQSLGSLGTATTVLHGGAGAPSFSAVALTADVSGVLPVANGGTGISSLGTGVATALGVNVGSAGAFVTNGGALGTPSSGVGTNLTGTASGLTAGDVANAPVIAKVLTGFSGGAGTVSASDSILSAFQKIDGNVALKAPIGSPTFTGSFTATGLVTNASLGNMADTTIKGRAVGAGTGAPTDLTATQVAAVVGSVGGALKSKVISATKDMTQASGNVAYTGFGFQPSTCLASAVVGSNILSYISIIGFADSALTSASTFSFNSNFTVATNFISLADSIVTNVQTATVASYDADGLTLAWVKTGSPTGSATIKFLCYR